MNFVNVLDTLDPITEPDPDAVVDWTDLFKEAIDLAVGGDFAGVLVPARDAPYRFRDPGANMNIDLRGVHDFVLMGEGPRSVLAMVDASVVAPHPHRRRDRCRHTRPLPRRLPGREASR